MMSRILSRLWTLSPGTTSFTTGSVPSWRRQDRTGHQQEGTTSGVQLDQNVQGWTRVPSVLKRLCAAEHLTGPGAQEGCPGQAGPGHWFTYVLLDAELQTSILDHVDAVVFVPRPEQAFALLQLDEDHVTAKLQEEGLLEVAQDPAAKFTASGRRPPRLRELQTEASRQQHESSWERRSNLTFFSM